MKKNIHVAIHNISLERESQEAQIKFLEDNGIDYEVYTLVPFSHEIYPALPKDKLIIPFGCIEFVQDLRKIAGIDLSMQFDDDIFTNENCINQWKSFCLNNGAKIMTTKEAVDSLEEKDYFVRPVDDKKSFRGKVYKPSELKALLERYSGYENNEFNSESIIVVSELKEIKKEWRTFVVDGKVVSSSLYRDGSRHREESGAPDEVLSFCSAALRVYNPAKAFVLDVCELVDGSYAIVEFGCIHSCGFYKADVPKITGEVIAALS